MKFNLNEELPTSKELVNNILEDLTNIKSVALSHGEQENEVKLVVVFDKDFTTTVDTRLRINY